MGVPFPALKMMVTVFLLLMGNMSPVVLSCSTSLNKVKTVASEAVTTGTSLACFAPRELAATGHKVTCVIEVENWTRFPLMFPRLRIVHGFITTLPTIILPGKREAFALQIDDSWDNDVYGTVSWELEGTKRRFVLMWSAPYDFHPYRNWMGLGMTKQGSVHVGSGRTWFDQMYYHKNSADLTFERKDFNRSLDPLTYSNDKFEVEGTMTNGHRALINVVIRPNSKNWDLLARPFVEKLQQ